MFTVDPEENALLGGQDLVALLRVLVYAEPPFRSRDLERRAARANAARGLFDACAFWSKE